jgi:hypothetical protein
MNRRLPLIKWLLAIPHYIVLFFLPIGALVAVIVPGLPFSSRARIHEVSLTS